MSTQVVIDPRFNGFPNIALGGYVGGMLARGFSCAESSFLRPVRTGKPYERSSSQDGREDLLDRGDVIASVRKIDLVEVEPPAPVGLEASKIASRDYVGNSHHPYPNCFVCGPSRHEGDGLRIFPGIVPRPDNYIVAAPWYASKTLADNSSNTVRSEFIWSALDCPTIWPLILYGEPNSNERVVSARFAVELVSPVTAGEHHVMIGWKIGEEGKTRLTGGAIYSIDGRLLVKAKHTLVATNWGVPLGLNSWPQVSSYEKGNLHA